MFWRFGGYANISTIDTILDKPDLTLEELLDEPDLIQELKQNNAKLIEFLREEPILERLLKYVLASKTSEPRSEEGLSPERNSRAGFFGKSRSKSRRTSQDAKDTDSEEKRMKYAYVACEVLSSEVWSISESLVENSHLVKAFWQYIKQEPPLEPLQAGYFTKVNEALFDRKTEEMVTFVKTLDGVVEDMMKHVDCPMLMDLLLKLISLEGKPGGQGIVDWLQAQGLIPRLLAHLTSDKPSATQTSAGDFLKAIITISANATGQDASVIGPNELTRELVSEQCVKGLIHEMLKGGNPLTVGVGIVIEVIRKNNSDYDTEAQVGPEPKSSDPIYLGNLLRIFSAHISDFMELILSSTHTVMTEKGSEVIQRRNMKVAWGDTIEPLGFDRFKTCELMAELLHCSNMVLLNERGSEEELQHRDAERVRLKQEGKLGYMQALQPAADFGNSVDSSDFHHAEAFSPLGGSPDDLKSLETQNNGEDEEFEKVAMSEAIPESSLEEVPASQEGLERHLESRHAQDDEYADFVDEPLSPKTQTCAGEMTDMLQIRGISSPGSGDLTDKVDELDLDNDLVMADNDLPRNSPQRRSANAPPISLNVVDYDQAYDAAPAPLFANRANKQTPSLQTNTSHDVVSRTGDDHDRASAEHKSSENELTGVESRTQQYTGSTQDEDEGEPVVGDLLKMMFVEHQVVPTILDFFFRFPWNNFLHNVVYDVVQQVFNGAMDRGYNRHLAVDLFETGRITERIVEGQARSDKAQQERKMRLGYMGHLTLIAEEVIKFNERQPAQFLSHSLFDKFTDPQWTHYVEHTLSETRARDNAILGGVRPNASEASKHAGLNPVNAVQSGLSSTGSVALANAGLTGASASGLDSMDMGITGYTNNIMSGTSLPSRFGGSDDDDDGEMEEGELGADGSSREGQGTDNIRAREATTNQDLSTAPPVPAPLAIPPSRARRQLAARLAEKKRLASTDTASSSSASSSQPSATTYMPLPPRRASEEVDITEDDVIYELETVSGDRLIGGGGFAEGFSGFDAPDLEDEDIDSEDFEEGLGGSGEDDEDDRIAYGQREHGNAGRGIGETQHIEERQEEGEDDDDEDHGGGIGSPLRRQTTRNAVERRPLDFGDGDDEEEGDDDPDESSAGTRNYRRQPRNHAHHEDDRIAGDQPPRMRLQTSPAAPSIGTGSSQRAGSSTALGSGRGHSEEVRVPYAPAQPSEIEAQAQAQDDSDDEDDIGVQMGNKYLTRRTSYGPQGSH